MAPTFHIRAASRECMGGRISMALLACRYLWKQPFEWFFSLRPSSGSGLWPDARPPCQVS